MEKGEILGISVKDLSMEFAMYVYGEWDFVDDTESGIVMRSLSDHSNLKSLSNIYDEWLSNRK